MWIWMRRKVLIWQMIIRLAEDGSEIKRAVGNTAWREIVISQEKELC